MENFAHVLPLPLIIEDASGEETWRGATER